MYYLSQSLNCWVYSYTSHGNSVGILTVVGKHIGIRNMYDMNLQRCFPKSGCSNNRIDDDPKLNKISITK